MANPHGSRLRLPLLAAGLAWVASAPAHARVVFDPSLELGVRATDNVSYQGSGSSDTSDTIGVLSATVHLIQETQQSTLNFNYRPEIQRYQDFDELDNTAHSLDLDWVTSIGRRGSFGTEASYDLTQDQGVPQSIEDPDLFLTQRTDRQIGHVRFIYEQQQSRLWSWELSAEGGANRFDAIEGLADPVGTTVEDRNEYGAAFGMARQQSTNMAVGGRLSWGRFDLEESGEEDTISLVATWDYQAGRTMSLEADAGVFYDTGTAGQDEDGRFGLELNLELEREWAERQMRVRLENSPSAGGALSGSSIDSMLTLTYESATEGPWNWELTPHAARRTPTEEGQDTIYAAGARVGFGRRLGDHFGMNLRVDYYDQSDDNSVSTAELALRWNLLRQTAQAER